MDFSAISFLIVDDSRTMRSLLRQSLLSLGVRFVFTVGDSEQALDFLQRPEIDAALIDYQLQPEDPLNGLDLVRALRQMPAPLGHRPVLFFTAYADRETEAAAAAAGANAVMAKPFSLDVLQDKLAEALDNQPLPERGLA